MKIVQSFWTGGVNSIFESNFGWESPYYHLLSWVLSANQLQKYYKNVELYTDKLGYDILINKLNLPYSKVHVVLDGLNSYDKNLWALAKIKTYQLQEEPFIHVDGDVFIWKKFPETFKISDLITQNLEKITSYYTDMWENINNHLIYLPNALKLIDRELPEYACNMGIVGGTDLAFFKKYCECAFDFVDKNIDSWDKINGLNFNIFFEQVLFYQLSTKDNMNISYLFEDTPKDNNYKGFGDFHKVPHNRVYLHLLGNYKKNPYSISAMRDFVIKEYPTFYKRILNILNVEMDYMGFNYTFFKNENEKIISNFKQSVINNKIKNIDNKYLFERNLNFVELPRYFDYLINNKNSFILKRLPCNSVIEKNSTKFLKIHELNENKTIIPIDELDEILLDEINNIKEYDSVFNALEKYLEEEVKESEKGLKVFNKMIADRIRFFITRKILYCYKDI